ncbi:hypothetical protein [Sporomusa sp.]|uniref:hypothetical protein n=1 Tax=Sporomusa sp. TaxID=2078658 RepID=UPI002C48C030|nr:hypothetical protein [Sporomusa sp.]HWR42254.1 hypothetical protein [Sporomusa sp.]
MNNIIAVILTGIFLSLLSFPPASQAQSKNNPDLNAKQQNVVTIAAFTTNGNLEKLKIALNEGLDNGNYGLLCCHNALSVQLLQYP